MRRSMHSLIVALLCLTLFVDSAKACWWLRQHRSRAQVCRPTACRPAAPPACAAVPTESVFVDDHAGCGCCDSATAGHAVEEHVVDHGAVAIPVEQGVIEQGAGEHTVGGAAAAAGEPVVVHGPTTVIDAVPVKPAPTAPEPASVVTPRAGEEPAPATALAMPAASAGPAVLKSPTSTEEPIPDLKPAIAAQSPVEPASNEQPMPERPAAVPQPADADTPTPAPVEDLAGGPATTAPLREPPEPNLFDLYPDVGDDDVAPVGEPSAEAPADGEAEMTDDEDAGEAAEEPAEAAAADDEAEMAEEDAETAESAEGDAENEPSADDAAEEPNEKAAAPEAEPEKEEADPFAAVIVPDEPMRRWANDAGTHHAQGWLVEVRADRVRILKVNGRHTTVAIESLSAEDRDYVSAVGARLAAERQDKSPVPTSTAGL